MILVLSRVNITTPELKAAWERGERDRFYPLWQDLQAGLSGAELERNNWWPYGNSPSVRKR
jgi:hypothetical protein